MVKDYNFSKWNIDTSAETIAKQIKKPMIVGQLPLGTTWWRLWGFLELTRGVASARSSWALTSALPFTYSLGLLGVD
jgi:hypothetical protein